MHIYTNISIMHIYTLIYANIHTVKALSMRRIVVLPFKCSGPSIHKYLYTK